MNGKVSIIMPAYNAAAYIKLAIESVRTQSYTNWELLVVNDGSIDDTKHIVTQIAGKDPRIILINQANGRQGKARNTGINRATGEWIAFLDADDLWMTEKLEKQMKQTNHTGADVVFSDAFLLTEESNKNLMHSGKGWYQGSTGIEAFLKENPVPILTLIAKKKVIEDAGGFSEEVALQNAEDYHLWLKLLLLGKKFWGMDEPLALYRIHSNSISSGDRFTFWPACSSLMNLITQYPEYRSTLARGLSEKIIGWLKGGNAQNENEFIKASGLYFEINGLKRPPIYHPMFSKLVGWKKLRRQFISHYA